MLGWRAHACIVIVSGMFRTPLSTDMLVSGLAFIATAATHFYFVRAFAVARADRGSLAVTTDRQQCEVRRERAL